MFAHQPAAPVERPCCLAGGCRSPRSLGSRLLLGSGRLAPVTVAQPHQAPPPAAASPTRSGSPRPSRSLGFIWRTCAAITPAETGQKAGDAVHARRSLQRPMRTIRGSRRFRRPSRPPAPAPAGGHACRQRAARHGSQLMVCHLDSSGPYGVADALQECIRRAPAYSSVEIPPGVIRPLPPGRRDDAPHDSHRRHAGVVSAVHDRAGPVRLACRRGRLQGPVEGASRDLHQQRRDRAHGDRRQPRRRARVLSRCDCAWRVRTRSGSTRRCSIASVASLRRRALAQRAVRHGNGVGRWQRRRFSGARSRQTATRRRACGRTA